MCDAHYRRAALRRKKVTDDGSAFQIVDVADEKTVHAGAAGVQGRIFSDEGEARLYYTCFNDTLQPEFTYIRQQY